MTDWHEILKREVAASNVAAVARKMGYARTSVSLALHGRYPGKPPENTKYIAAAVIETFSKQIVCPHLQKDIAPSTCRETRDAPMPQSDRIRFRHWTACQSCPNNPGKAPTHPVRKAIGGRT